MGLETRLLLLAEIFNKAELSNNKKNFEFWRSFAFIGPFQQIKTSRSTNTVAADTTLNDHLITLLILVWIKKRAKGAFKYYVSAFGGLGI